MYNTMIVEGKRLEGLSYTYRSLERWYIIYSKIY